MLAFNALNKFVRFCLFILALTLISCYYEDDDKFVANAGGGNLEGVKSILKKVKDINVNADDGWTALTNSACRGHKDIVEFLLNNGADVNKEGAGSLTPIYWAAFSGHIEIVKLLLQRGADINRKCPKCELPIEIAEIRGHQEIVKLLSEHRMATKGATQ